MLFWKVLWSTVLMLTFDAREYPCTADANALLTAASE